MSASGPKELKDPELEKLIRAHVRKLMEHLEWGTTDLHNAIGFDQGYLHAWLNGTRKSTSAALVKRLVDVLGLDPLKLFKNLDRPEARFFEFYVPKRRERAPEVSAPSWAAEQPAPPWNATPKPHSKK